MKYIRKGGCPHEYSRWCNSVAGTGKADFREVPRAEKQALLTALIAEQGALCAYTMRRIDHECSHIEHIKPQRLCRTEEPESDLDYANLVACFPRDGMKNPYRYGAQLKADWWENDGVLFVSPLDRTCEQRFRFDVDGKITAVRSSEAAMTTIRILALNHPTLTEDRRRAIREFLYGSSGDSPLTPLQANRAIAAICRAYRDRQFHEFCIAISHALLEHIAYLGRIARRRRISRRRI